MRERNCEHPVAENMKNGNLWKILAITAAATMVAVMLPDIKRYIRMSMM
jgi:hypothetical protein